MPPTAHQIGHFGKKMPSFAHRICHFGKKMPSPAHRICHFGKKMPSAKCENFGCAWWNFHAISKLAENYILPFMLFSKYAQEMISR
jgi:hypothetical protein